MTELTLNRRKFIAGSTLVMGGLSIPGLLSASTFPPAISPTLPPAPHPRRKIAAVFLDMPFFDQSGLADRHQVPRKNQATVDYVSALTEEQLLRRHCYC